MWPTESPENQINRIHDHQALLRAEAATAHESAAWLAEQRSFRVDGFRLQIGDFLIVVGRKLRDDERALHPAH
jgi:hypothetical protein